MRVRNQAGGSELDANAKHGKDDYVMDIFGNQYTILDEIERLLEKLPKLFIALTG